MNRWGKRTRLVALAGSWLGGAECGGIANDGRLGEISAHTLVALTCVRP